MIVKVGYMDNKKGIVYSAYYPKLTDLDLEAIIKNDGLTPDEFYNWFWEATNTGQDLFEGFIIHWTDKRYYKNDTKTL